jgi:hypothetical protein
MESLNAYPVCLPGWQSLPFHAFVAKIGVCCLLSALLLILRARRTFYVWVMELGVATDQPGAMALTRTRPQGKGYTHAAPLCGHRATARRRTAMDKATKQTREVQRLGRRAITTSTELTGLPVIAQPS